MTKIEVDLRTKTVAEDQRVWRLFPGSGYRFLDAFKNSNIGYLDFPGLSFEGLPPSKVTDLIPRIAMSDDYKSRLFSGEDAESITLVRSDFSSAKKTQNRGRLRQAIINFYGEAKSGDLVILPGPIDTRLVHIGEFGDNTIDYSQYATRFPNARVPSRNIKWSPKAIRENSLSSALSESLRHQQSFSLIERSRFVEVMSLIYSSFVYQDKHVSTIYNGNDFLDIDSAFLGTVSKLAAAACRSMDEGRSGLGSDVLDLLLSSNDTIYSCSQESDIHSDGFTRYISSTVISIAIAVLVISYIKLSVLQTPDEMRRGIAELTIINTAPGADPACLVKVSEVSMRVLQSMDLDNTLKLCKLAREASRRAHIRSSAQ